LADDRLLEASDVAEILGVPKSWVEEHARQGDLPSVQLGRYRRYTRADVDAFIERCRSGEQKTRRRIHAA
jgi:excisionase family DNA binding protein